MNAPITPAPPAPSAGKRHWEINPILVKELRQAVRNWTVTTALLLLLLIFFFITAAFLLSESASEIRSQSLGAEVFGTLMAALFSITFSFLPLYVGIRLAWERMPSSIDLFYITTLTPGRIIRGKLLSGIYLTILFFSVTMPFMAFTYLLRGVDLPTIFTLLLFLFLANVAIMQLAILVAALPINRILKLILALFFGCNCLLSILGIAVGTQFGGTLLPNVTSPDFWATSLSVIGIGLLLTGLAYTCSVACVTPLAVNRALPLRIYSTIAWFLGWVIAVIWTWKMGDSESLEAWLIGTLVFLTLALMVTLCERDRRSIRVRQAIPQGRAKRFLSHFFYNGPDGGLAWCIVLGLLTLALYSGTARFWGPGTLARISTTGELLPLIYTDVFLYLIAYALTALWLHRRFLGHLSAKFASTFFLLLPPLLFLIPALFFFFINRLSWSAVEERQLGSLFNLFEDKVQREHLLEHFLFAIGWLLVMFLLNARWFIRQTEDFKPYHPEEDEPMRYAGSPPPKLG